MPIDPATSKKLPYPKKNKANSKTNYSKEAIALARAKRNG